MIKIVAGAVLVIASISSAMAYSTDGCDLMIEFPLWIQPVLEKHGNNGELDTCEADSTWTLYMPSTVPTPDQMSLWCLSSYCRAVFPTLANVTDCEISPGVNMKKITDDITKHCAELGAN